MLRDTLLIIILTNVAVVFTVKCAEGRPVWTLNLSVVRLRFVIHMVHGCVTSNVFHYTTKYHQIVDNLTCRIIDSVSSQFYQQYYNQTIANY